MHLEAAEAASNGIGLDVTSLIGGVVLAVIVGTLVPFATEQWSMWARHKSALYAARRKAVRGVVDADVSRMESVAEQSMALEARGVGGTSSPTSADIQRIRVARAQLWALFTTSDQAIIEMMKATNTDDADLTPVLSTDVEIVLATWAAGRNIRARRAARRLVKKHA